MNKVTQTTRQFRTTNDPIRLRMPGGKLSFFTPPGETFLYAYGAEADYMLRMDGTTATLKRYPLSAQCPIAGFSPDREITVRNTTTNRMVMHAEDWEAGRC